MDPKTGRSFYANEVTGERQWAVPRKSMGETHLNKSAVAGRLAPSPARAHFVKRWEEKLDQASGRIYFVCKATGESSWARPASLKSN